MAANDTQAFYFNSRYDAIDTSIKFNPNWANGTGYFDNAVRGPNCVHLPPGVSAKSIAPDGRRMIFVGTRFGTIVMFNRYSDLMRDHIFVHNASKELDSLGLYNTSGTRTAADVKRIVGDCDDMRINNIGMVIEAIFKLDETMRLRKTQRALEEDDE